MKQNYVIFVIAMIASVVLMGCGSTSKQQVSKKHTPSVSKEGYKSLDTDMLTSPTQAPSHSNMTYSKPEVPTSMENTVASYTKDQDAMRIEENKKYGIK